MSCKTYRSLIVLKKSILFCNISESGTMAPSTAPSTSSSRCAQCRPLSSPCWPSRWTGGGPSCPPYTRGPAGWRPSSSCPSSGYLVPSWQSPPPSTPTLSASTTTGRWQQWGIQFYWNNSKIKSLLLKSKHINPKICRYSTSECNFEFGKKVLTFISKGLLVLFLMVFNALLLS